MDPRECGGFAEDDSLLRSFFDYLSRLFNVVSVDSEAWQVVLFPDDPRLPDGGRSRAVRFRFEPSVFRASYPFLLHELYSLYGDADPSDPVQVDEQSRVWDMMAQRMDEASTSPLRGPLGGGLRQKPGTDWFEADR